MTELVERVARAIAKAIVSQTRSGATFEEEPCLMIMDHDSNSGWDLEPVVRAAIAAARQWMVDEGKGMKFISDQHAMFCAAEVIDEALK